MKTDYWFYIDTYVHISVKKNWVMLYNSLNSKILEYQNKPEILTQVKKLRSAKNLRVIPFTGEQLQHPQLKAFVNDVIDNFMGDLVETRFSETKPIQMTPEFKILDDVTYLKNDKGRSVGEKMMKYLLEVNLFINGECTQQCSLCRSAHKQFNCCRVPDNNRKELPLERIEALWDQMKGCSLSNVNILGGDIFMHSRFNELLSFLNGQPVQKSYHLHYLNANAHAGRLQQLSCDTSQLKLLVTFPLEEHALEAAINTAHSAGLDTHVEFIITEESHFEKAEALCSSMDIKNPHFQPFYNGENQQMFRENLFVCRDDLVQSNPSLQAIHAREEINELNFGRLTVLNDGQIHANVNTPSLGKLGKDTLYEILYKEMYNGKSWRNTRKHRMPCKQCVFQSMCPPLSNLNIAMKQNNLCDIFPFN